ncbi:MAG TPA: TMEM175 family protein, partial [Sphingomicrobium sp.]|nr:TMEM175 family protein [Sphingomicrobium sp.]
MKPDRLNAFTDGVLAVVITLMVLELHTPVSADFSAVRPWLPLFGVYVLSFVNIGIFWNNHHHMMQAA